MGVVNSDLLCWGHEYLGLSSSNPKSLYITPLVHHLRGDQSLIFLLYVCAQKTATVLPTDGAWPHPSGQQTPDKASPSLSH